jgi:hypothetical protein
MLRQKAKPDESDPHRLPPEAIEGPKKPQTAERPGKSGPHYFTSPVNDSQEAPDALSGRAGMNKGEFWGILGNRWLRFAFRAIPLHPNAEATRSVMSAERYENGGFAFHFQLFRQRLSALVSACQRQFPSRRGRVTSSQLLAVLRVSGAFAQHPVRLPSVRPGEIILHPFDFRRFPRCAL